MALILKQCLRTSNKNNLDRRTPEIHLSSNTGIVISDEAPYERYEKEKESNEKGCV